MKRLFSLIVAAGFTCAVSAQQRFTIGSVEVASPAGWTEVKREDERLTLRPADGQEQATISIMHFGADASFDDFKRLCQLRLDAEKKESSDVYYNAEAPSEIRGLFVMTYHGIEKRNGRLFSGHLSLKNRELVTIYVEGFDIAPKENLQTFEIVIKGLKQK